MKLPQLVFPFTYCLLIFVLFYDSFSGTIVGLGDNASPGWANSEWRSLKVSLSCSIIMPHMFFQRSVQKHDMMCVDEAPLLSMISISYIKMHA